MKQQYEDFEDIIVQLLRPTIKEKINLWIVKLKVVGKRILRV